MGDYSNNAHRDDIQIEYSSFLGQKKIQPNVTTWLKEQLPNDELWLMQLFYWLMNQKSLKIRRYGEKFEM